jgi:hypothetical protein
LYPILVLEPTEQILQKKIIHIMLFEARLNAALYNFLVSINMAATRNSKAEATVA